MSPFRLGGSLSYEQASDYAKKAEAEDIAYPQQAVNYTLSTGRLIFPKSYTGYGQVNFNVMAELLGQYLPERGRSYLDIAPSLQFIFNSQTRVDIGYRHMLYSTMSRTAPSGFLLRVEHVLFNAIQ